MKKPKPHEIYWTVLYANGARSYFKTEESARIEALMHGIGLTAPIYREI